ncbi:MAG: C1 family peptidase, partial [Slackia sp.]|nr:C1 family peptidase [Slackia sp.]
MLDASSLPSRFDLRDVDGVSYVTPVKNQNPWGSCWAFSTLSALESNLIMQGAASADPAASSYIDLSERYLAYFSHTPMPAETLAAFGASSQ